MTDLDRGPMSRTVVLVHGAWHGAWCWEQVLPLLDAASVPIVAVDLPSVSHASATLHDDADYVRGALDSITGDAVLVGHSYGGAVISEAGVHPAVAHLVYLTAFALEVGESPAENALTGGDGPSDLVAAIDFGDGVLTIDPERAVAAFYHDCTPEIASAAVERLRPQSLLALGGKVDAAAWREKPATYVVCTDDRALPVALQRSNAARIGNSIDWPTSHSPFLEPARPRRGSADRAQLALTIAATSASEVTRVVGAGLEAERVHHDRPQPGGARTDHVDAGHVADVPRVGGLDADRVERDLEDLRVGLADADRAGVDHALDLHADARPDLQHFLRGEALRRPCRRRWR